ncbi:hypothetical protein BTN49_0236 [Candidatus Enterovibrio escicola]|uniref:Uncharacterized protein n=1 Tax=Candidatus Enterovibrio escicola TaxID=1927127 RepID=A0A2A5T794_9GAMM|nr:hypothetical protein BTN49_0236 [Candidatus Enterovibrio escacola]
MLECGLYFVGLNKIEPCRSRHKPATKIYESILLKDVEEFSDDYHG